MRTLEDAWVWYNNVKESLKRMKRMTSQYLEPMRFIRFRLFNNVKESLKRMKRMGSRYWEVIPWDQAPWRSDNHFVSLEKEVIIGSAQNGLENLDDLAVVVLFSVFEAL